MIAILRRRAAMMRSLLPRVSEDQWALLVGAGRDQAGPLQNLDEGGAVEWVEEDDDSQWQRGLEFQ
eukprot:5249560-Amphidinium_carterae.1